MNDGNGTTRRDCLRLLGLGVLVAAPLAGCKGGGGGAESEPVCTDTSTMAPADVNLRTLVAYVDKTPDPAKHCDNCAQWAPPSAKGCGTCKLFRGPVSPKGYCKSWSQKV